MKARIALLLLTIASCRATDELPLTASEAPWGAEGASGSSSGASAAAGVSGAAGTAGVSPMGGIGGSMSTAGEGGASAGSGGTTTPGGTGGMAGCPQGTYSCAGACAKATDPACAGKTISFGDAIDTTLPVQTSQGLGYIHVAIADVDGDGNLDWVGQYRDTECDLVVMLGKGDGTFTSGAAPLHMGDHCGGLSAADIDGDGRVEIVAAVSVGAQGGGSTKVLRYQGAGITELVAVDTGCLWPGDFDGDGRVDLMCLTGDSPNVQLTAYLNDGKGSFTAGPPLAKWPSLSWVVPVQLGARTVLIAGGTMSAITVDAGGVITLHDLAMTASWGIAGDLVGDGSSQLVLARSTGLAAAHVAPDAGSVVLAGPTVPGLVSALSVGDVNGDGRPDLLTYDNGIHVYQQLVDGTFVDASTKGTPYQSGLFDVNGDGLPDIVSVDSVLRVFLNTSH